jgi:hypothetical protein
MLFLFVFSFGFLFIPISIVIAIFRYRLWDIDLIIRRTLVYGLVTALLGLVYFGAVVVFREFFRLLTGQESPAAIVISTLVIAALFTPLRTAIQALIDRRFYRRKYNAEQALARFQHSIRDRVNLDEVEHELAGAVQMTVQPEWLAMWMRRMPDASNPTKPPSGST